MSPPLLYRLFRIGRLHRDELARLAEEGSGCIVQGIPLTISWRHFRQPGRRTAGHRQSFTGCVALTDQRLHVYAASKPVLDLALTDPVADRISVTCPQHHTLSICLDAQDFHSGSSGQITYWLLTAQAATLADLWQRRRPAATEARASTSTPDT
jgi:hypothetical protein